MPHPLTALRVMSIADGISFLYLLYHSIYSKRILGIDEAIRVPGMIHGVLFCLFAGGATAQIDSSVLSESSTSTTS